jgi:diguanylate cyclase (GGDEF)-like protein
MQTQNIATLITFLGLSSQTASAALLVVFFLILRGHALRRRYFVVWGQAWIALALALAMLLAGYLPAPARLSHATWLGLTNFAYQVGKLFYFVFLVQGTLLYTQGIKHPSRQRLAYAFVFIYAIASYLAGGDLAEIIRWQAVLAVAAYGGACWLLLSLPQERRTFGSRAAAAVLGVETVIWGSYFFAFSQDYSDYVHETGVLAKLAQHNAYLDLILQMLLGFGMVLILLEDAKRETDTAHRELEIAHARLLRESLLDSMTGAYNRRAFADGTVLEKARQSWGTVVVMDLDNLKQVNDSYGHRVGDEMLKHVTDVLRASLRPSDKLFRWGGDEFLVVMPGADTDSVRRRLEIMLDRAPPLEVEGFEAAIKLQASVGAAPFKGANDLERAVHDADRFMYEQKRVHKTGPGRQPPGQVGEVPDSTG